MSSWGWHSRQREYSKSRDLGVFKATVAGLQLEKGSIGGKERSVR